LLKQIAKKIYRAINPAPKLPNYDGAHSRNFWATRDAATPSFETAWTTRTNNARTAIGAAVAALPGDSVLEIGSHAGQNLWAIAQQKPDVRLAGVEISPIVLEFACKTLPEAIGRPVELLHASADKLPFPDNSFDIVLSGGSLVCIGPEAIMASLNEMVRVCRGHLVLAEPFSQNPAEATPEGRKDLYPNTSYWIRNYVGLLEGRADKVSVQTLPLEDKIGHLDSITILKVR
jgi:ubiquinone/menaquinone biosynthesis C-methylase UbiE